MENQLTNKLLKDQKSIEVTAQKNEQLLLSTGNDEYNHIKKAFGLDDTDKIIDEQKRKLIELEARKNQYNSNKIIDEEFLIKFCMDNGYVLTKLDDYKGKLSKEMLKSIDDYCKSTGHSLSSDNNYGFYILCSFNDVNGNNYDLKKSKRYSKSQSNKFIILFKLSNGNAYQNNHYDYVYEEGKLNSLTNLKNKLFNLHVNQRFTLTFFIVGLVINFIIYFELVSDIISLYYDHFRTINIVFSIIYSVFFLLIGRKYGWLFDSDTNKHYYHNYDRYGNSYLYIYDYISKISNISLSEFRDITIKKVMFTNVIATILLISSLFISVEIHKINYINKVGKIVTNIVKTEDSYTYDVIERKGLTYKIKTKQFKIK